MTEFLQTLSSKLTERWLALLTVPSLLLMTATAVAVTLGQQRWYNIGLLLTQLNRLSTEPALRNIGTLVLILAALLVISGGLAAIALGGAVEQLWLTTRPRWLTTRRRRRWDDAHQRYNEALKRAGTAEGTPDERTATAKALDLNARRNRISLTPPTHVFWLGDRITATDTRIWGTYQLDLVSAWPRLWLILPEDVRAEIGGARVKLAAATRLVAWAVGYLAVGAAWWPSAIIGVITAITAWHRARVAGIALVELAESAVDLHARKLAESLGIRCEGKFTDTIGIEITMLLRKQT